MQVKTVNRIILRTLLTNFGELNFRVLLGRKRKLRISAYFFCSFNFHLNSILFKGYFWLAAPEKTLRFPRATLQLPQKKPTSSGIFSWDCAYSSHQKDSLLFRRTGRTSVGVGHNVTVFNRPAGVCVFFPTLVECFIVLICILFPLLWRLFGAEDR